LALTSNKGSQDFQVLETGNGQLHEEVLRKVSSWGTTDNIMFVVGATHPESFLQIRKVVPDHFLLIPGVGAQGGDLHAVCKYALNDEAGVLINSSRGIIYASQGEDFAQVAGEKAKELQVQMADILKNR